MQVTPSSSKGVDSSLELEGVTCIVILHKGNLVNKRFIDNHRFLL